MNLKHGLRSQSGMGLAQVMVGVAISGIVSMLLVDMFSMLTQAQGRARMDGDIVMAMDDVRRSLSRTTACKATLASGGIAAIPAHTDPPLQLTRIVDEFGASLMGMGTLPTSPGLKVHQISVRLNENTPTMAPNSLLVVDIMVSFEAKSLFSFGPKFWQRQLPLTIETNSTNEIVSCNSVSIAEREGMERAICATLKGSMSGSICDLSSSESIVKAACTAIGLNARGAHCGY